MESFFNLIIIFLPILAFGQRDIVSTTVHSGKKYPTLESSNRGTFRLYLPNAQSVIQEGGDAFKNVQSKSTKSDDGYCTVWTSPI